MPSNCCVCLSRTSKVNGTIVGEVLQSRCSLFFSKNVCIGVHWWHFKPKIEVWMILLFKSLVITKATCIDCCRLYIAFHVQHVHNNHKARCARSGLGQVLCFSFERQPLVKHRFWIKQMNVFFLFIQNCFINFELSCSKLNEIYGK